MDIISLLQLGVATILLGAVVFGAMLVASRWGAKQAYYDIAREVKADEQKKFNNLGRKI